MKSKIHAQITQCNFAYGKTITLCQQLIGPIVNSNVNKVTCRDCIDILKQQKDEHLTWAKKRYKEQFER